MTPHWASFYGRKMRTIEWDEKNKQVLLIDQTLLPAEFRKIALSTYQEMAKAINTMVVRGAPAIGVAAAYGMALAGLRSKESELSTLKGELSQAAELLNQARPTAVNLKWATDRVLQLCNVVECSADDLREAVLAEAHKMADEDVETNLAMARFGADLIEDGDQIVHHCNTGALATVDYGTALGVIRMAHEKGKKIHVYVDETRPRLQGARLTAWELSQYGIPYDVIVDSASGYLMRLKKVDKVFFGADRVASNGDVVNKIGTYMLALAAYDNGIPAYSVFPLSTVDFNCSSGDKIDIEERNPEEVLGLQIDGKSVYPAEATAKNYAFDVTPHRLLSGLVTEKGVLYQPFFRNLAIYRPK